MSTIWSPGPVLVAGPCVLEGDDRNLVIARHLAELGVKLGLRVVYKASFDKANRSTPDAPRGPGLQIGLDALRRVREETGLPVLTDVHEVCQVEEAAGVADVLQVPAFLCRQTDLLGAVGASGRAVNVKKGQWMAPRAMAGAVDKVWRAGGRDIVVTERGTFFGYGDLIVDMRAFEWLRAACRVPVLFDGTHAVQRPSALPDGSTGGCRADVPALLRAAAAAGADGFFLETHPAPAAAPSDATTMWPLDELESLLEGVLGVWQAARPALQRLSQVR